MAIQSINNRITFDNMFLRNKNTTTNYFHDIGYFRPSSSTTIVEIDMMMCFFTRARDRINSPKFIEIGEGTLENISSSIVLIYLFIFFIVHLTSEHFLSRLIFFFPSNLTIVLHFSSHYFYSYIN